MAYETPWGEVTDEMPEQAHYVFDAVLFSGTANFNHGCELAEGGTGTVNLFVKDDGSVLFNSLNSGIDIGGFQFNIAGATLTSTYGGSAAAEGFMITHTSHMVLAFSLSGTTIAEGCGTLIDLDIEGESHADTFNMTAIILSDAFGQPVNTKISQTTIGSDDWVGAFNGDVCVGAQQWDRDQCENGICSVRAGGFNDLMVDLTEGYMLPGDIPTFKIYDSGRDIYFLASTSGTIAPWADNGIFTYTTLIAAEMSLFYSFHQYNNLVSFPIVLADSSLEAVFGATHDIEAISSAATSATWDGNSWSGTLQNIDPKKGYWVRTSKATALEISGTFLPNPTYNMQQYNNLISYPGHEIVKLQDAFPLGILQDENIGASGIMSLIGEATSALYVPGSEGYVFDGSGDRIQMTCDNKRQPTSYSFWARMTATGVTTVLSHGEKWLGMLYFNWNGDVLFSTHAYVLIVFDGAGQNVSMLDGQWHHYALAYDDVHIMNTRFWMDGVEWGTEHYEGSTPYGNEWLTGLTIGSENPGGYQWPNSRDFEGEIKDFAWFDVVISDANVTTIYNGGVPTNLAAWGSDLKGYWRFDGNVENSAAYVPPIGPLSFAGFGDRVTFASNVDDDRQPSTYSFWARSTVDKNMVIFSHGDKDRGFFAFGASPMGNPGAPMLRVKNTSWCTWDIWGGNSKQYDGNWHHYVVTLDDVHIDNSRLWVDSVEATPDMQTGSIHYGFWDQLMIGSAGSPDGQDYGSTGTWNQDFEGDIKEFAWFDTVLTEQDVDTLYNSGTPIDISGWNGDLKGYWRFDGTADDSSGNNFDGTAEGAEFVTYGCDGFVEGAKFRGEGGWIGSLMHLHPRRSYWMRTHDAFSFQFNLETTAQCSQDDYPTEAGCTGAGYEWVELLTPPSGN